VVRVHPDPPIPREMFYREKPIVIRAEPCLATE